MEWDNGATIGYSAAGDPYENNDPSTSEVACLNSPLSNWTNVVFRLSESSPELEPPSKTFLIFITDTFSLMHTDINFVSHKLLNATLLIHLTGINILLQVLVRSILPLIRPQSYLKFQELWHKKHTPLNTEWTQGISIKLACLCKAPTTPLLSIKPTLSHFKD